jgi:uncharacterized protein (DUF1499 family)
MQQVARIAPLALQGSGPAPIAQLRRIAAALPGAKVVEARDDYLYLQFTTRWMKFVDDAEFWFDPANNVVQLRSASSVGRKDFGVNRARIETIRQALAASGGCTPAARAARWHPVASPHSTYTRRAQNRGLCQPCTLLCPARGARPADNCCAAARWCWC